MVDELRALYVYSILGGEEGERGSWLSNRGIYTV